MIASPDVSMGPGVNAMVMAVMGLGLCALPACRGCSERPGAPNAGVRADAGALRARESLRVGADTPAGSGLDAGAVSRHTGPAHPLLVALRDILERTVPGRRDEAVAAVDLAGTAHASPRALAYFVLDRAVRELLPVVLDHADLVRRARTLRGLVSLQGPRGLDAVDASLEVLGAELEARLLRDACERGEGDCPDDPEALRCAEDATDAASRALRAMEDTEPRAPASPRARRDGGDEDVPEEHVEPPPGAEDIGRSRGEDGGTSAPFAPVVRAIAGVARAARECVPAPSQPLVLGMLRDAAAFARASPPVTPTDPP